MTALTTIRDVAVDDEFRGLCPPLADEEREQLLANVMRDGFRDPVTVWSKGHILLDGHNRRDIWQQVFAGEEGGPDRPSASWHSTRELPQEWVIRNQFGRRNLTAMQRAELALKLEPLIAKRSKQGRRRDLVRILTKVAPRFQTRRSTRNASWRSSPAFRTTPSTGRR